jgi:hypothetical protein
MLAPKAQSKTAVSTQGNQLSHRRLDPRAITAEVLTKIVNTDLNSDPDPTVDGSLAYPLEVAGRSRGNLVVSQWLDEGSPYRAILNLIRSAPQTDQLQLTVATSRTRLDSESWQRSLNRSANGRASLELTLNGTYYRVSPFETLATNRPLDRWFARWLEERALTSEGFFKLGGQIALLDSRQFIINRGVQPRAYETYRGKQVIPADNIPENLAEDVTAGIARWFMANQDATGALPYKYWPSRGLYSTADNPIRRLMASVAFNRLADSFDRHDIRLAAKENLAFNLRHFYRTRDGHGVIEWQDSVKLGALAIAGLAIVESPFAAEWSMELAEIRRTIDSLWQPSGAFRTFFLPADRNDNQNFYPGEALVFWATSLAKSMDDALLQRALTSVSYYREHFRKAPNPAFVPWHTQAVTTLYRLTGDHSLRDYVFEMNDWLLPHQQWGGKLDLDYWGRFYTPDKPSYGPPHASATGVYLEGLVDALDLAIEAGDSVRADLYRTAIERGIRSIAQLQYADAADAFHVSYRERVIGAIRTESDNNEIRIDNMQHALAALLKYRDLKGRMRASRVSKDARRVA